MSAYAKVIHHTLNRNCKQFLFYADNCGAQNKNWTLFTGMVALVNEEGGPESITVKYLEKGHTFMSADSFHARIEAEMRKKKNLYDFSDFQTVIGKCGQDVPIIVADFTV